jgi:hypothetical protein
MAAKIEDILGKRIIGLVRAQDDQPINRKEGHLYNNIGMLYLDDDTFMSIADEDGCPCELDFFKNEGNITIDLVYEESQSNLCGETEYDCKDSEPQGNIRAKMKMAYEAGNKHRPFESRIGEFFDRFYDNWLKESDWCEVCNKMLCDCKCAEPDPEAMIDDLRTGKILDRGRSVELHDLLKRFFEKGYDEGFDDGAYAETDILTDWEISFQDCYQAWCEVLDKEKGE